MILTILESFKICLSFFIFMCFQVGNCILPAMWGHCLTRMLLMSYDVVFVMVPLIFPLYFAFGGFTMLVSAISWPFLFILFGMCGSSWFHDLMFFARLGKQQTALISSDISPLIFIFP